MSPTHWLWLGLAIAIVGLVIAAVEISIGVLRSMRDARDEWRTKAFCPGCKSELCSNGAYVGETDRGLSVFECRACKLESFWDFYAPVPLLIKPARLEEGSSTSPDEGRKDAP